MFPGTAQRFSVEILGIVFRIRPVFYGVVVSDLPEPYTQNSQEAGEQEKSAWKLRRPQ
jgi:hypothetical protein